MTATLTDSRPRWEPEIDRYNRWYAATTLVEAMIRNHEADPRLLGRLHNDIEAVHDHWTCEADAARDGMQIVAQLGAGLDREEYRQLAEGLAEDGVHGPDWYAELDRLVDFAGRARAVSADAAEADGEVDDPHLGTQQERQAEALRSLGSDVDASIGWLLTPVGGGRG